jgi:WD40 repeat protein
VRVWSLASESEPVQRFVHPTNVNSAIFSPDGRRVATAGLDGWTRVWDVQTGSSVFAPLEHTSIHRGYHRLAFTPDGRRLIAGGSEGNLLAWDADQGMRLWKLKLNGEVKSIAISPDGRRVVAAVGDPQLTPLAAHVFDIESGRPVGAPLRHGDGVSSAQFSRDGKFIVTAGEDRATRVWEAETGNLVSQVRRHTQVVSSASFSPDGRYVVSSSHDRTVLVWEAASGQIISLPLRHEASVTRALFSPDGRRVLTATHDGLRLWDLSQTDLAFDDLLLDVQASASLRLDSQLGLVPLEPGELSNAWHRVELLRQAPK